MAENRDIKVAILEQQNECDEVYARKSSLAKLETSIKSRAHKGMTWIVIGLFGGLLSLGVAQTRWLVGMSDVNSEKIHKLEIDTALQLKELQAQQGIIIQGIGELKEDIRVLTEKMIPE